VHPASSHLHAQQVAKTHLSDIVADELVIHQSGVGDVRVAGFLLGVGLFMCQFNVIDSTPCRG
jgi:hypothetical protein